MKIDLLTASTKKADITISDATFGKDFNESSSSSGCCQLYGWL